MQSINKFTAVSAMYKGKFLFTGSSMRHINPTTHLLSRPSSPSVATRASGTWDTSTSQWKITTSPWQWKPWPPAPLRHCTLPVSRGGGKPIPRHQTLGRHARTSLLSLQGEAGWARMVNHCSQRVPVRIHHKYNIYSATVPLNNLNSKEKKTNKHKQKATNTKSPEVPPHSI